MIVSFNDVSIERGKFMFARIINPLAILLLVASTAVAQKTYPPKLPGAEAIVYKSIGDVELKMYLYRPADLKRTDLERADLKPTDKKAAIVFFFGGGWRGGSPQQFEQQCRYLADRGMVAVTADYRVSSRHKVTAKDCVSDAKSAVRYLRTNAARLGIDPDRIVAAGGSAGGHLAACTGVLAGFDTEGEDLSISSVPNAMVLFNPALVLAPIEGKPPLDKERMAGLEARMGVSPEKLSPYHQIASEVPPTIIFHGEKDTTVPFETAEKFDAKMRANKNSCKLVGYPGESHGFFNYGRKENKSYNATVAEMDRFLVELKYLEAR